MVERFEIALGMQINEFIIKILICFYLFLCLFHREMRSSLVVSMFKMFVELKIFIELVK